MLLRVSVRSKNSVLTLFCGFLVDINLFLV